MEMLKGYMDRESLGNLVIEGLNASLALSPGELWLK